MTGKQIIQFNQMRTALKLICEGYMTPSQIHSDVKKGGNGLSYEEYLKYSYENIQETALNAVKNVRVVKI